MAAVRMTNALRDQIRDKAVADIMRDRKLDLIDREDKLAREYYYLQHGSKENMEALVKKVKSRQKALAADVQKSLPEGVEVSSTRGLLNGDNSAGNWSVPGSTRTRRIFIYARKADGSFVLNDKGSPSVGRLDIISLSNGKNVRDSDWYKAMTKWHLDYNTFDDDEKKLKEDIESTLKSFSTLNKFIETFPTFEKYCPPINTAVALPINPDQLLAEVEKARSGNTSKRRKKPTQE